MQSATSTAAVWEPPLPRTGPASRAIVEPPALPANITTRTDSKVENTSPGVATRGVDDPLRPFSTIAQLASRAMVMQTDAAVMQIWEGTVRSVDAAARTMDVVLEAKMGSVVPHSAQIELQWVPDQDIDLVRPGAVFYLTLFKQTRKGSIQNSQELRFRRRPGWSDSQIEQVKSDTELLHAKMRAKPQAE